MAPPTRAGRSEEDEPTAGTSSGVTWFFGIGINAYEHWPKLHNAVRDVTAVKDLLVEQYGLRPEHVQLLLDEKATRNNILTSLDRLADTIQSPDNLIIYYAGHGHLKRSSGFWVPGGAGADAIYDYISNAYLKELIGQIPSLHTLLLADSCFSGNLLLRGRGSSLAADKLFVRASRYAICSGRHDEEVDDGPDRGHSPFAQSILDILGSNEDHYLTAGFLKEQIIEQTGANANQLPDGGPLKVEGHKRGQYVFRRTSDEDSIWRQVQQENSLDAFLRYREQFPKGNFRSEALQAIEHLEQEEEVWEAAKEKHRISAYEAYRDAYPRGRFAEEAKAEIDKLREAKATAHIKQTPEKKSTPTTIDDGLIFIEGGRFMMGSDGYKREQPIHKVQVPSFYLGQYPVTFADYDAYCAITNREKPNDKAWGRDRRPVINVSWKDAVDYCNWLSRQRGLAVAYDDDRRLLDKSGGYRLPSEAEWEFAARGGGKSKRFRYAGSNDLDEVGWHYDIAGCKTQPVDQKKANELGLYDMSGNVWEWCSDVWHANYEGAPKDGSAWLDGGNKSRRVVRGGCWSINDFNCRVSFRSHSFYYIRNFVLGFRVARY